MEAVTTPRPKPADVPDDLAAGQDLGRVVGLDAVKARYRPELVQTVVDHMVLGDELAYDAWNVLRTVKGGKALFDQALEQGIDAVENPPAELVALFKQLDTVPDWVDWEQLRRGAIAMWRPGRFLPICLGYSSIGYGFSSYGGTKALNFTRLLIDEDRVGRRLFQTLHWVAEATTPDGMRRFADGFKASARVRMVHCAVRYGVSKSPKWQWNEWGLPITNTDLLFTTSKVFCANAVEAMERLGTRYTDQEREDIFALWRYIAYVMGVPDELNHVDRADCLYKNEIVVAVEHEPDEACRILLHSLIGFASKTTEGYQALPPWLTNRLSPQQKVVLSYGLLRYLTSDEFCDSMHIPDTKLKHLVAAASRLLALKERLARRLPHDDRKKALAVLDEVKAALSEGDGDPVVSPGDVGEAIQRSGPDLEKTLQCPVH